jgi:hypothetical protein
MPNSRNSFGIKHDAKDRMAGGKSHVMLVIMGVKLPTACKGSGIYGRITM